LNKVNRFNEENAIPLVTPLVGEKVNLNDSTQAFTKWWEDLE
jgi:hypothetical protein